MKIIYKYELQVTDYQEIYPPKGFQILTVQMQRGVICLWALVDNTQPTEMVSIAVVGTGNPFPWEPLWKYVGTVQQGEFLVWHVFYGDKNQ